jgi:hypothetical protein
LAQLALAQHRRPCHHCNPQVYKDRISKFLNNWMTGKGVLYTPKGLAMMPPNGTLQ